MAGRCVPGIFGIGTRWLRLIAVGLGFCQGLITSLAIPELAGRLTPGRHSFSSVAGLVALPVSSDFAILSL